MTPIWFSLIRFRSPLLSESQLFSLPVGTEMFHFPTFPPTALCVQAEVTEHNFGWVSPFGNPRITAWLPASQGLSQAPTSFIGSRCQGIHHVLLVACIHYKDARVHCEVLKIRSVSHKSHAYLLKAGSSRRVRSEREAFQPDPSGPNSVPGRPTLIAARFLPRRVY